MAVRTQVSNKCNDAKKKTAVYSNRVNAFDFTGFTCLELNLLMVVCYLIKDKGFEPIVIPYRILLKLARCKKSLDDLHELLKGDFHAKLSQLRLSVDTGKKYYGCWLFESYIADNDEHTLTLKVSQAAEALFNDLDGNFTILDIAIYSQINSVYGKLMYQHLSQFRCQGWWEINIHDFCDLMCVPEKYTNNAYEIQRNVINKAITHLSPYMSVTYETLKNDYKRGNPVTGFRFTFDEIKADISDIVGDHVDVNTSKDGKIVVIEKKKSNTKTNKNDISSDDQRRMKKLTLHITDLLFDIVDLSDASRRKLASAALNNNRSDNDLDMIIKEFIGRFEKGCVDKPVPYLLTMIRDFDINDTIKPSKSDKREQKTIPNQNRFKNFEERDYDMAQLEKYLLAYGTN